MSTDIERGMTHVNRHRAIVASMTYKAGAAERRARLLLKELREEAGGVKQRGSLSRVVERTGLDQAHVSKALSGERGIGLDALETMVSKLRLRWDYFFGPVEPSTYRDFLGQRYAALSEFLALPEARLAKPDERAFLASCSFVAGPPDVATYRALLSSYRGTYGYRARRPDDADGEFAESYLDEAVDEEIQRETKAKDGRKEKPAVVTRKGDHSRDTRST